MDDYDRDRHGHAPHVRGNVFEHGARTYFRDEERGYSHGSRKFTTSEGKIRFDHVKEADGKVFSIEDKSGRIEGDKDVTQLKALRELLDRGVVQEHTLRSVAGETVSKECQVLINGLKRDFPERFTHQEISRSEARAIWAIGKDIERGKEVEAQAPERGAQLELDGVGAKAREEKAVDLQKRKDRQISLAKARDTREKFQELGTVARQLGDGAQRGRDEAAQRAAEAAEREAARNAAQEFPTPDRLRESSAPAIDHSRNREAPETDRDKATRDAAEKATREFQERLSIPPRTIDQAAEKTPERESPETARDRVEREAAERVANEFPVPQPAVERDPVERDVSDATDAARAEREAAAERQREQERAAQREAARAQDAAYRERLNQAQVPDAVRLGLLGQAQDPHAAVRERPGPAPKVQGHGREGGESRGISRDR
ncbi:hypothetical protein [Nocardia brasiliensis]|uniref:hypothetical protein n=1 Tax=Nocardia brasiliensis TaxID=37326 RepID=UPI00245669F1|nr:hypothetical protein [Nocardia brasiliensis]